MNSYFNISILPIVEKLYPLKLLIIYKFKSLTFLTIRANLTTVLFHQVLIFNLLFRICFNKLNNNKISRFIYRKKIFKKSTYIIIPNKYKIQKTNLTFYFKNNYLIFLFYNKTKRHSLNVINYYLHSLFFVKKLFINFLNIYKRVVGDGFYYIRGLFIIFFIDASITDDEPL
jgi:hypothetical protein